MKNVLLCMLLSVGVAQAAQLERPIHVPTLQAREVAPPHRAHPRTSPALKAEITRRMFWLALSLR
ncbi:MAG: hypothetical protein Q8Q28_00370 [Pseudomonadota bacterium]|nr:hypothetical protein [Pseudomonadota bacterium]